MERLIRGHYSKIIQRQSSIIRLLSEELERRTSKDREFHEEEVSKDQLINFSNALIEIAHQVHNRELSHDLMQEILHTFMNHFFAVSEMISENEYSLCDEEHKRG